ISSTSRIYHQLREEYRQLPEYIINLGKNIVEHPGYIEAYSPHRSAVYKMMFFRDIWYTYSKNAGVFRLHFQMEKQGEMDDGNALARWTNLYDGDGRRAG
ncbi:hypothetical protein, partial [Bacillus canaveralius]|uniref:hypothetical protein n=1 Tax=Bacillus canaveralius TaxID=1403243 RepID=UPI001C8CB998